MEERYQHTVPGQEITEQDINLISTDAALADDHVFQELFRLGPGARGVTAASVGLGPVPSSAIIKPSGSSDATVTVNQFRAFLGPLSPANYQDNYKNGRSAVAGSAATMNATQIQFPAATNNRWDLILATVDVDIDGPTVSRYVKTGVSAAVAQTLVGTKKTTVSIGRVQGTEAGTPTKPALPADSGSSYNIPIAYVLLPAGHTLTTAIAPQNIDEVAPVIHPSRATGASSLSVATGSYQNTGAAVVNEGWTPSSGRPSGYLPPTMCGKRELVIPLHFGAAGPYTVTPGAAAVAIEESTDWRYRYFKIAVACGNTSAGGYQMAHKSGGTKWIPDSRPSGLSAHVPLPLYWTLSQSFHAITGVKAHLVFLSEIDQFPETTNGMATSSTVELYVDMSTGKIMCVVSSANPQCELLIWVEATAQFNNCF